MIVYIAKLNKKCFPSPAVRAVSHNCLQVAVKIKGPLL